ncbi:histidine kinase [Streptomyces sp. NPDC005865]|uniref:sensor histidine kinase n=1 Tax=Streptomyces sp. NPDC005865 TaxID=3155453 RepID=UPI0033D126FA
MRTVRVVDRLAGELPDGARPRREDIALGLLACALTASVSAGLPGSGWVWDQVGSLWPSRCAPYVVGACLGVSFLFCRRCPVAVALLAMAANWLVIAHVAMALALLVVGIRRNARTCWVLGWVAAANAVAAVVWHGQAGLAGKGEFIVVLLVALPLVLGHYARRQRELLAERTVLRERERQLLVESARAQERSRIAGEMHDAVAHRITHAVLLATLVRDHPEEGTPWTVEQAALIRQAGVRALEELREAVGALREPAAPCTPPLGIADLAEITAQASALGNPATLYLSEGVEGLPPLVERTVVRVVREALTNAARYAPGASCTVQVRLSEEDTVTVEIRNDAVSPTSDSPVPSGGNGLIGLAERIRLLSGTFTAGPTADGFRVHAVLPQCPSQAGPTPPSPWSREVPGS